MADNRKRLTELPVAQSFEGLYTLGVNARNEGVRFAIGDVVNLIQTAANNAELVANSALETANSAVELAQSAVDTAEEAAQNAQDAVEVSADASELAQNAVTTANEAKELAEEAVTTISDATLAAQQATQDALAATAIVGRLYPTAMTVVAPKHLTVGNVTPVQIKVQLSPETVVKNVIFIGDHNGAEVTPQGILHPTKQGASTVYVIPTCNTALTQAVLIDVTNPTMRLAELGKVRFSANGTVRLT